MLSQIQDRIFHVYMHEKCKGLFMLDPVYLSLLIHRSLLTPYISVSCLPCTAVQQWQCNSQLNFFIILQKCTWDVEFLIVWDIWFYTTLTAYSKLSSKMDVLVNLWVHIWKIYLLTIIGGLKNYKPMYYTNVHNYYIHWIHSIYNKLLRLLGKFTLTHFNRSDVWYRNPEWLKITHRYCISVIQSDVVVLSVTNFTHHTTAYVWSIVASASCHLVLGCIYGEEECNCERIVSKYMYLKKGKRVCQLCVFTGTHKVW